MDDPRTELRTRMVDQLRKQPQLTGIQIEYGWPGDQRQDECLSLGPVKGTFDVPVFHGQASVDNPLTYDDDFRFVAFLSACTPGQTSEQAERRGRHLWQGFLWVARTAGTFDVPQLIDVLLEDVDDETPATKQGFVFFAYATVHAQARLEGPAS